MRKFGRRAAFSLVCALLLTISVSAEKTVIPGGQVIGIELQDGSVCVAAFDDQLGGNARSAGLQIGDKILSVDGQYVSGARDISQALERSNGTVILEVERKGKTKSLCLQPQITKDGPRLGVYLQQGITGVGTVTWYEPDSGSFGALGHGVHSDKAQLLQMKEGRVYRASVAGVKKGEAGDPGQLLGLVENQIPIGTLTKNTTQGIYGTLGATWSGDALPVGSAKEVRIGPATIRSTVQDGNVQEYSVEILKIYPAEGNADRNLLLQVTDPQLLQITGGIVQGMSGSPIIQDGKLVGAVTHVLVNDPTTGYGIFIENMLEAAA